jgi:hypothetical protein
MLDVFSVTCPFFALVLAGFLATTKKMMPLEAIPGLNIFVLYFALPCMLFRFGTHAQIDQLLNPAVLLTYFIGACVMVTLATVLSLSFGAGWNNAAFGALVAAFPNTGFMGVPLLLALFGLSASGTAIVTITIDMVFTTSLCIALSRLEGAGAHGIGVALRRASLGIVMNPMPWAIGLGVLFCALNLQLVAPLDKTVQLLGDAASPTALFTVGAVLARSWMMSSREVGEEVNALGNTIRDISESATRASHHPVRDYWSITILKLVVHPMLVFTLGRLFIEIGMQLDANSLKIMVLIAALPSASNVVMLSQRYGADNERIAKIILLTTAIAFLSFSSLVKLYS